MLTASLIVIFKIYRGSKHRFAYILMSFTAILGFAYIGLAFNEAFRKKLILANKTYYAESYYTLQILGFLLNVAGIQGWIFAIRYLTSAIKCR